MAGGESPPRGNALLIDHHQHAHTIAIAVIALFAKAGDVGQPALVE
jgi:hypothetical protein